MSTIFISQDIALFLFCSFSCKLCHHGHYYNKILILNYELFLTCWLTRWAFIITSTSYGLEYIKLLNALLRFWQTLSLHMRHCNFIWSLCQSNLVFPSLCSSWNDQVDGINNIICTWKTMILARWSRAMKIHISSISVRDWWYYLTFGSCLFYNIDSDRHPALLYLQIGLPWE